MSCGGDHEVDCTSVLQSLDAFVDGEDSALDRERIQQHLTECGPCLQERQIEELVKAVVARACGNEPCSDQVRTRVVSRIRELRVDGAGGLVTSVVESVTSETRTSRQP